MLATGDGDHATGVLRADVAAADAHERRADLETRQALGRVDRRGDGLDGAVDVHDDALAQAVGGRLADPDDVDAAAAAADLADEDAHLRRADVDRDEDGLVRQGHPL